MIAELRGSDGGETQIASDELGPEALLIEMAAKGATFYSRFALKKLLLGDGVVCRPSNPSAPELRSDHIPGISRSIRKSRIIDPACRNTPLTRTASTRRGAVTLDGTLRLCDFLCET